MTQLFLLKIFGLFIGFLICYNNSKTGLRINQSKSEILWLGSLIQRKDLIFNLKLSAEPVYALSEYFSYDEELATKKTSLKNCLT